MRKLLSEADVFVNSYRPGVPEHFGLGIEDAVAHSGKGIIYLDISCYGKNNIWSERPGFETIGQACSGFSVTEAEGNLSDPKFSPVFYLNDPLTSYFALSGVLAAIHKRAIYGGSYCVNVSLARSAMWVEGLGLLEKEQYKHLPITDIAKPNLETTKTIYGDITRLSRSYSFDKLQLANEVSVHPFGADKPSFIS